MPPRPFWSSADSNVKQTKDRLPEPFPDGLRTWRKFVVLAFDREYCTEEHGYSVMNPPFQVCIKCLTIYILYIFTWWSLNRCGCQVWREGTLGGGRISHSETVLLGGKDRCSSNILRESFLKHLIQDFSGCFQHTKGRCMMKGHTDYLLDWTSGYLPRRIKYVFGNTSIIISKIISPSTLSSNSSRNSVKAQRFLLCISG